MESTQWITGEVALQIGGNVVKLKIPVPDYPVKPEVMLPVFQNLANAFTDLGVQQVEQAGESISCRKGCGACCRQPVPLAEIEIYHIAKVVAEMPEPRRSELTLRFEAAAAHFQNNGWYEKFENCNEEATLKELILAYFSEKIACPFLEEESCSIHPVRPVVCREYLVTSPAIFCAHPEDEEKIRQIPLPLNVSSGVMRIAESGQLSTKKFLPMVFALEWTKQHPESFEEKSGEAWLGDFFGGE